MINHFVIFIFPLNKTPSHSDSAETGQTNNTIYFKNASEQTVDRIMGFLAAEHISVTRFERKEPDLEELFMEVIKKQ